MLFPRSLTHLRTLSLALAASTTALLVPACVISPEPADGDIDTAEQAFSSDRDVLWDFRFDGEVITDNAYNPEAAVNTQLYYTVGQLNGWKAVGRLDTVQLSDIATSPIAGGMTRVTYSARLEVAWGDKYKSPESFTFKLPRDVSYGGLQDFVDKYAVLKCLDWVAHDVTPGSHWYYYRPDQQGCSIDSADLLTVKPAVSKSELNTNGKYPEYHEVWKDRSFKAVLVYGRDSAGASGPSDFGVAQYHRMNDLLRGYFVNGALYSGPKLGYVRGDDPGAPQPDGYYPDIEYTGTFEDGRTIRINMLLVDNPQAYNPAFDTRYGALSTDADLIVYNGHAALGGNVRAMTKKGKWKAGKYVIVYMNGCDSFAYVDGYLAQARAALNPEDPTGTKYLDMITNAMPANPTWFPEAMASLINGLIDVERPQTFQAMLKYFAPEHMAVVTGDEDNVFEPGMPIVPDDAGESWEGFEASGTVLRGEEDHYETEELDPGSYVFRIKGTGDADLYVRTGAAPTVSSYDCRPYVGGSVETCTVDLQSTAKIHVMVRGWASTSDYELQGIPADKADGVATNGPARAEQPTAEQAATGCAVRAVSNDASSGVAWLLGLLAAVGLRKRSG